MFKSVFFCLIFFTFETIKTKTKLKTADVNHFIYNFTVSLVELNKAFLIIKSYKQL